jgi:ribosomal-protein-alanine N-acetyltransferase
MVGFVAGDLRTSAGWAWIATIGVDPRYRRRGIGRALLRACEGRFRLPLIKLTVRASNRAALGLYEMEGYQTSDVWERYYRGGEDAVVMHKEISEQRAAGHRSGGEAERPTARDAGQ